MATGLERVFLEFAVFLEPLRTASGEGAALARFLARFGYRLDAPIQGGAIADLSSLGTALGALATAVDALPAGATPTAAQLGALAPKVVPVFDALRSVGASGSHLAAIGLDNRFFGECFDLLLHDYVRYRSPLLLRVLMALDAIRVKPVTAAASGRHFDYARIECDWGRLGQFMSDFDGWARDVYGWGDNFDYANAIDALGAIFDTFGLRSHYGRMTVAQVAAFVQSVPAGRPAPTIAYLPFADETGPGPGRGAPTTSGELGLALMPVGNFAQPAAIGLGFAPYAIGSVGANLQLTPDLSITTTVDAHATGGATLALTPAGVSILNGAAVSARFAFEFAYERADGSPVILIGEAGATRVEFQRFHAAVGGALDGEFFAAAGVEKPRVVVDVSADGFLSIVVPRPIEVEINELLVGWRSGRGIYFEGGTGLSVTVPLDLPIGPFHVHEIGLEIDWAGELAIAGTVTAEAKLGPLYAYVEGLGLVVTVVPNDNGALGRYDLAFGLKLPTAYAVALDAAPIEGGGYLSVQDAEYRGALALRLETLGISAFAIFNTRLPGGAPGFSFVASIFGDFVIPLGYGFFLTGLGGLIGVNRTANTEALRDVLYEGRLDSVLFPADPITNAATILDDMAAIFPPREGQYVFGPMARISFGQPPLVEITLGVVLEVGAEVRLLILGSLASHLPTRDTALVVLSLTFFGEIDFGTGTIAFDATLQNSRVLSWAVSGDMAARTGWGPGIDHIISFGGLHPSYPKPPNLPDLRRLSINFGTNNPRVTLSAYQALTLNSLQFGARGELYAKGPKIMFVGRVAAEGHAYFDALIYFNPFAFDIALGGGLSLLVDGEVECGLGFDLRLTGPNNFVIDGKVWVTIFGIDVDFGISHSWGEKRTVPTRVADPVAALREALTAAPTLEPVGSRALSDGVRFAAARPGDEGPRAASPAGGLRFSQRAMPLGVTIEKLGEAEVVGTHKNLDLAVFAGATALAMAPAELDFVRGHFFKISEAERLRAPTYERRKSGFEISSAGVLRLDTTKAIDVEYGYEVVEITAEPVPTSSRLFGFSAADSARIGRLMDAHHRAISAPLDPVALVSRAADAPAVHAGGFTSVSRTGAGGSGTADTLRTLPLEMTESELFRRNPVVADYVVAGRR